MINIRRLRAKLGRHEPLIETVRNVGYRFKK
ncbi:winged helix-turn-helix domain-containing protein [Candidatus Aquicultor secundus]